MNYFKDLFEPKPDNRKIVLILFLNEKADDTLTDSGFLKHDIKSLNNECKKSFTRTKR